MPAAGPARPTVTAPHRPARHRRHDYRLSQGWSGAIHAHHSLADGILYGSRHHNRLYCVALFERAQATVVFDRPHWGVLGDPASPDLFGQTVALLRRFAIQVNP